MPERGSVLLLIVIMTAVSCGIGITAIGFLYHAAFTEESLRLVEIVRSHARLIEAISRFDENYSRDYPKGPRAATLSQIKDAHAAYEGFGKTGEFTLAERQADAIQFILPFRHVGPDTPKRIPLQSNLAEPMRHALAGSSGTLIGLDYRGVKVLAAYEPIPTLDLGIVAKMDLVEIRAPFLRAGGIIGTMGLLLVTAGIILFFRVTAPMLQRITDSEERFRSISTAAQDAIIMINDRDQIEYWNPAAERILGYTPDEALGKQVHDWLAPERFRDDHRRAFPHFAASGQGAVIGKTSELAALRKGGETFPMELSVSSLRLKGRWYALGVLRDITARKHAERLLQEAEARWRLLLNSTGEGIYGVDTNDRCTFVNAACLQILGYQSLDSLLGKNIHPLIHHSRLDGTPYPPEQCQIYQSYRHGKNIHIDDEVFWRSDGTCFPVEYRARPLQTEHDILGCIVTFTDITERKRAEEALRHERDFAESLIETAQVIVLVLDPRGCIVRFNRFMEELSGYCLEEVRGQDWFDTFLPEQDRERVRQAFQRDVSNAQTIGRVSWIITHAGQQRLIEWYDRTLKGIDGQVMGVLAIGHDITEHKQQEAQLLQSQKMEVVGQLTGGIAHDFNNLLTIIVGNLDCLSAEVAQKAAPEIQELLKDAVSAARDAAELTQRLLALSRRQALKPDNIGLDKVVSKLKKFLQRILGKQFELHVNTPEDRLTVFADPARLENALLNLIINARDAMPRGGPLTIDIFRKNLAAAEVASSSLVPGSYAVMRVTDSGTGMSPDVLSHAVEPFFTTKKSGRGTGLGAIPVNESVKLPPGEGFATHPPGF
jgi:PAS domain S-box-containing protein